MILLVMLAWSGIALAQTPATKPGTHQPSWEPHMRVPDKTIDDKQAHALMGKYCMECHKPGAEAIDHELVPGELDFTSYNFLKDEAMLRELRGHTTRPESDPRGKQMPPLDDPKRKEFIASGGQEKLAGWFIKKREEYLKKHEKIDDHMARQLVNTHCVSCHKPEGTPPVLKHQPDLSTDAYLSDAKVLANVLQRASLGNDEPGTMPPMDKPGTVLNHDRREWVVSTAASQLPQWLEAKLNKLKKGDAKK
jgi:mono/diheme cytochrome c family protein